MDTEEEGRAAILSALQSQSWSDVVVGIAHATEALKREMPNTAAGESSVAAILALATHEKWEVRRAVALAGAQIPFGQFEPVLARLAADSNQRVRQAAVQSAARRGDTRYASVFNKEHDERINARLNDIQRRFGERGRRAVKGAAEDIANTFVLELNHEVMKLLSPLATAAERLEKLLQDPKREQGELTLETKRIGRQVRQLEAVLNSMRSYTATPKLEFAATPIREVVEHAVLVALGGRDGKKPEITLEVPDDVSCEVAESRLVQAIANLVANAIESYEDISPPWAPIRIAVENLAGVATITIRDRGAGMSRDVLEDAPRLFASRKRYGTGFGLPFAIKIVETEHAGRLRLDSEKGAGTTVQIALPLLHRNLE